MINLLRWQPGYLYQQLRYKFRGLIGIIFCIALMAIATAKFINHLAIQQQLRNHYLLKHLKILSSAAVNPYSTSSLHYLAQSKIMQQKLLAIFLLLRHLLQQHTVIKLQSVELHQQQLSLQFYMPTPLINTIHQQLQQSRLLENLTLKTITASASITRTVALQFSGRIAYALP